MRRILSETCLLNPMMTKKRRNWTSLRKCTSLLLVWANSRGKNSWVINSFNILHRSQIQINLCFLPFQSKCLLISFWWHHTLNLTSLRFQSRSWVFKLNITREIVFIAKKLLRIQPLAFFVVIQCAGSISTTKMKTSPSARE